MLTLMFVKPFCYAKTNIPRVPGKQPNVTQVDLTLKYDINVPEKTSKVRLVVPLPSTLPDRQKIIQTKFSIEPTNILEKNKIRYAEFIFNNPPKQISWEINVKAEVYRYDLYTAQMKSGNSYFKEPNLSEYLRAEKYIEKDDPMIQEVAARIVASSELSTVKAIYDYVIDNMDYNTGYAKIFGAAAAIREKKGVCKEYANLFVALCRAKGIPARVVHGYMVEWPSKPRHDWAEVYLIECGWVPFEPTIIDKEKTKDRNVLFHHLNDTYLYTLYGNEEDSKYGYWFYYSGDKPTVKESINIKKSS